MRISFCTACMDRLFHLRETYLENIANAGSDVEFVLLDYGGADGVGEWVSENRLPVSFHRTSAPRYWVASHAKNVAHRLATGEVLCNLDCDVRIPPGFVEQIRRRLSSGDSILVSGERDEEGNYGCSGLVAVRRDHFMSVNGYDESMNLGWSFESSNFVYRVAITNSLKMESLSGATCIDHSDETRTMRCQLKDMSFTSQISRRISDEMVELKIYKANTNSEWGRVSDIQSA